MISAIILAAHLIFITYIFTKKWQEESLSAGLINVALIIILFSVGWSISTTVVKIFFDEKGLGIHFNADTISLTLLSIAEFFFYRFYYKDESIEDDKEM
ncbi:hypothetical protein [Rosettibacter firmus]|uniref:hypothetical protein n=1 Tax=Rosettibacter firmus TaxID=3111522 RepID=UPI00336BD44F